jgi:hypothetical protein
MTTVGHFVAESIIRKREVEKEQIEQLSKSFADSNFGDVMVAGGGISGIQASLDLATAGAAIWPSLTRPIPPMTAPCEYSRPNWSRSAGIPI